MNFDTVLGILAGISLCFLWAKLGGDEKYVAAHPIVTKSLKMLHHYMIGLLFVSVSFLLGTFGVCPIVMRFLLGMGTGLFIDDGMFHSFELYMNRIIEEKING